MKSNDTTMHDMALSNACWSLPTKQSSKSGNNFWDRVLASQLSLVILVPIGLRGACRKPQSSFESVE